MSYLDLTLAAVLLISALIGLWRGLVVEVWSLVSWLVAFMLSFSFGGQVAGLFATQIEAPALRLVLGHLAVFIVVLIAGGIVLWLLRRLIASTGLSGTDRMLGLLFGVVRGAALNVLLLLLLGLTTLPAEPGWRGSELVRLFLPGAEWLRLQLPPALAEKIRFA